jgi:hypothetical protein
MGLNDPDQHLAIFGATTIGFKAPYQGQGRFRAQMNFSEIVEQFEASKHDGLHSGRSCVGLFWADVGMRGLM